MTRVRKRIDKFKKNMSVKELFKLYKDGVIRFDLAIQRNKVWNDDQKSLFLDTLFYGYPFPEVFVLDGKDVMKQLEDDAEGDEEEYLWILDGQQRLTTVLDFINNEIILNSDVEPLDDVELANKNFDSLPEEFKDIVLDTIFEVNQFRNITIEEVEEIFFRLNNGSGLTRQELNRVRGGITVIRILNKYKKMPFFAEHVNLGKKPRERFVDEELLEQVMMLLFTEHDTFQGFNKKAIGDYAVQLKDHGLTDNQHKTLKDIFEFLGDIGNYMEIAEKKRAFKKTHVPIICVLAKEAFENNDDKNEFRMWLNWFFERDNLPEDYKEMSRTGTGKASRILGRLEIARKSYQEYKNTFMSAKA